MFLPIEKYPAWPRGPQQRTGARVHCTHPSSRHHSLCLGRNNTRSCDRQTGETDMLTVDTLVLLECVKIVHWPIRRRRASECERVQESRFEPRWGWADVSQVRQCFVSLARSTQLRSTWTTNISCLYCFVVVHFSYYIHRQHPPCIHRPTL